VLAGCLLGACWDRRCGRLRCLAVPPTVPWPEFDSAENSLAIDTPITAVSHLITQQCKLWDSFGYYFGY
jgi:hypothetical protein